MLQEVSSEITFGIENEAAARFKDFFKNFDEVYESLGVESYGISITTLEEVFININKENGITDDVAAGENDFSNSTIDPFSSQNKTSEIGNFNP